MPPRILSQVVLFLISALVAAAEDFQCSDNTPLFGRKYDLNSLNVPMTVERTRNTPPSQMVDSLLFNPCSNLNPGELPAGDQCPSGIRACLTKTNKKEGQEDRIIAVIPLATSSALNPEYQALSDQTSFAILLHGEAYPPDGVPQMFNLTLICGPEAKEPVFLSYDGEVGAVKWSTPAACPKVEDDPEPDPGEGSTPSGSGLGWFFFLFFLALGAYFAIGAYHNYTNYGASGWDLVPHRDFWRDVPFLLRDLAQHLINAVRGGPSRGGYHAVLRLRY